MISAMQSALAGLQAFATKIDANANNIANVNTEKFKKDRVVLSAQAPQGVQATVSKDQTPGPVVAEETSTGLTMIEQSNSDLGEELPDLMVNTHGYRANLKTIQTADRMLQSLIDLKA